jgi:serine protease Do
MTGTHVSSAGRCSIFGIALVIASLAAVLLTANAARSDEPSGLAAAAAFQEAFVKAIESAEKSVVSISRDKVRPPGSHTENLRPFQMRERMPEPAPGDPNWVPNEFGAGIIIDKNGLILTNYHLVRGGPVVDAKADQKAEQTLYVRLWDRRGFEARIFAADPRSDLAVLKIPVNELPALKMGSTVPLRKGQMVIALGNPYAIARDGSASATWGIISNLSRQASPEPETSEPERMRKETIHHLGTLVQIDTRLDLGTSGGALLNLQGELIGMTTSLAAIVGYEKSAGFAIPFDDALKRIIESLRQGKEVEYGFLGIGLPQSDLTQPDWAPLAPRIKQFGAAQIESVVTNLPANRGGLLAGDLVYRVGDKPIYSKVDLQREIGLVAPGTQVRLKVFRREPRDPSQGREMDVTVEVGKWPVVDDEGIIASTPLREPWRGIVYDYGTSRRKYSGTTPAPLEKSIGVRVMEVLPDSPSTYKDIHPGDLITQVKGRHVRSPREFAEAVQKEAGPVTITVTTPSDRSPNVRQVEIKPR